MCRMMATTLGSAAAIQAGLTGLGAQAGSSATGPPSDRVHPHGWGLAIARPNTVPSYLGRRAEDASLDPRFRLAVDEAARAEGPGFLLGHIRNASVGSARKENTHPFVAEGWAFCHNGTVANSEALRVLGVRYEGDTDSERLFHFLLQHLASATTVEEGIRRCVADVDARCTYSSLTFLLTDGQTLFGYRGLGSDLSECGTRECQDEYYTLQIADVAGHSLVLQEGTHVARATSLAALPDQGLLRWDLGGDPRILPPPLGRSSGPRAAASARLS